MDARNEIVPRPAAEGTVPLICVEGTAYDCGCDYGQIVLERYPGYRRYLDEAYEWKSLSGDAKRLVEGRAGHLIDLYGGLIDVVGPPDDSGGGGAAEEACTSFGVHGTVALDGEPISGQTKDTVPESVGLYIVLRMRIKGAPDILVLAYPGEVLGYGIWSTKMSLFRNSLHSRAGSKKGLTFVQWGLLALAGESVDEAVELAEKHGLQGSGNCLISDGEGKSLSVEYNAGGIDIIRAEDGIAVHANHPVGANTLPFEQFPSEPRRQDSYVRMRQMASLLEAERGRLTPQKAMMLLADHTYYPQGVCRHAIGDDRTFCTTAAVVAEQTRGRLHVARGHPCCNWPVTYSLE